MTCRPAYRKESSGSISRIFLPLDLLSEKLTSCIGSSALQCSPIDCTAQAGAGGRIVLSHNRNHPDAKTRNMLPARIAKEIVMENVRRYRALASLCRQQAAYRPMQSWQLLGQAERWEHLAAAELEAHFRARNSMPEDEAKMESPHTATTAAA